MFNRSALETSNDTKPLVHHTQIAHYRQSGPLLFTHQGISGPAVLKLSSFAAKLYHHLNYTFNISINFVPNKPQAEIVTIMKNVKQSYPNRLVYLIIVYVCR